MQKIALIPAYCPEDRMLPLLRELKERGLSIVVVDDGSGKEYDDIFRQAEAYADVQRLNPNQGKGEALKFGLRHIKKRFTPPFTVVTADADGQHRVDDIDKISLLAEQHPDSLILGKRDLDKSTPIKSRIGNGISRVLYRLTTGKRIYETQTGLRAFSDRLLPRFLNLPGHRYEYEIDMLLEASDTEIIEEEIQTVYFDNNAASHFRPFRDTVSLDKEFFRYRLPSLIAGAAGILLFAVWAALSHTWLIPCIAARIFSRLLSFALSRLIAFSEKPPIGRFLITSVILLLCDTAVMWGLISVGVGALPAKLLSCILMTVISIVIRMLFPMKNST